MAANNNNYNNFDFRFPQSQGQFQQLLNQPAMNNNPQIDPYLFNTFRPWNSGGAFQFIPDTARNSVSPAPSRSSSECSRTNGEDDVSDKQEFSKKFRWSEEQTRVLLEEWKERIDRVESAQSNDAWKEIVREVNKGGPQKTLKQCKDKLKNLKQAYKEAKAKNRITGESPHRSPFYDELDDVLGTRPVITMPGVKQVGVSEYDPNTPASPTSDVEAEGSDVEDVLDSEQETSAKKGKGKRKAEDEDGQGKKKRAKNKSSMNFVDLTERFLDAQNQQMEMLNKSQERTEKLLVKMEMDQRKADEENRARDREFLLKMAELLAKK